VTANLTDPELMDTFRAGADMIVHFGGLNSGKSIETIISGDVMGTHTIFEIACKNRARVVNASSNHVIGFYPQGASPGIGDGLRIGSCLPQPTNERTLSTWLSYGGLVRLVIAAIEAERTDFAVVRGASPNARSWWHGDDSGRIGFSPVDNGRDPCRDERVRRRRSGLGEVPGWPDLQHRL